MTGKSLRHGVLTPGSNPAVICLVDLCHCWHAYRLDGQFGAETASKNILYVQALPGAVALALVLAS